MDRLPLEILAVVFETVHDNPPEWPWLGTGGRALKSALVCRRWATLALPILYTDVEILWKPVLFSGARALDVFDQLATSLVARPDYADRIIRLSLRSAVIRDQRGLDHNLHGLLVLAGLVCRNLRALNVDLAAGTSAKAIGSVLAAARRMTLSHVSIRSQVNVVGVCGLADLATAICDGASATTLRSFMLVTRRDAASVVDFGRSLDNLVSLTIRGATVAGAGPIRAAKVRFVHGAWGLVSRVPNWRQITHLDLDVPSPATVASASLHAFSSLRVLGIRVDSPGPAFWTTLPPSVETLFVAIQRDQIDDLVRALADPSWLPRLARVFHAKSRSSVAHEALRTACEARPVPFVEAVERQDRAVGVDGRRW